MALETDYGAPSVAVHADAFARLVDSALRVTGRPEAGRRDVPTPGVGRASDVLGASIGGADPTRGGPFLAHVLDALTTPLAAEDRGGADFDRSTPRLTEAGTEDDLQRLFR